MVELQGATMIDILVPVLNRPQNIRPLLESIKNATEVDYRVHFIANEDDHAEIEAIEQAEMPYITFHEPGSSEYPRKMNAGCEIMGFLNTTFPFLLLASDDLDFQPGWDTTALALAEQAGAGVIGTNDKANGSVKRGKFSTHCLIRRAYIEEHGGTMTEGPGVIFHEGYDHNFVDRELCGVAMHRNQWAFAADSVIVHRHPNWRTAPMDSTYEKGLATFHRDQNLFFSRAHTWAYEGLNPAERRLARRAAVR